VCNRHSVYESNIMSYFLKRFQRVTIIRFLTLGCIACLSFCFGSTQLIYGLDSATDLAAFKALCKLSYFNINLARHRVKFSVARL